MLSLNNLALRRGGNLLFENSTFTIHRGNKVGLIGANGTGKTSLFKMILGELDSDRGELELSQEVRIAHMAQEVEGTSQPAVEFVMAGDIELTRINEALARAESEERFDDIAPLHEALDSIDGYTARARAEQLMAGLGFEPTDTTRPLNDFSGGWRIRLSLARTLMQPSDLMLLDEPTNHLDLDAIIWLSEWIRKYEGTLLLISHDREFLDESVGFIAYLHQQRIELFTGNYSAFENLKAARLAEQQSNYDKQQREIAHMQDFVRRFRAKATKARQAQSRIKALERMELIAPAHIDSPFSFSIQCAEKISSPLVSLQDAVLGYDTTTVLDNVNVSIQPGDRIGLLGVNGAGKTTLVKSLRGEIPLLDGNRVEGTNLEVGYFSQHQLDDLDLSGSAMLQLSRLDQALGKSSREQALRNFLGGFNFVGDKVLEPVASFSGGEKARLALALITYTEPNLLLMDEPTNHLDIDMRQALTVALQTFAGALILVSHDRHLMANSVDRFILIEAGQTGPYEGDLADYRQKVLPGGESKTQEQQQVIESPAEGAQPKPATNHKRARQIRTRMRTLEDRMERLQRKLDDVEKELGDPDRYQAEAVHDIQPLLRDQAELKSQLEELELEWIELGEELES